MTYGNPLVLAALIRGGHGIGKALEDLHGCDAVPTGGLPSRQHTAHVGMDLHGSLAYRPVEYPLLLGYVDRIEKWSICVCVYCTNSPLVYCLRCFYPTLTCWCACTVECISTYLHDASGIMVGVHTIVASPSIGELQVSCMYGGQGVSGCRVSLIFDHGWATCLSGTPGAEPPL